MNREELTEKLGAEYISSRSNAKTILYSKLSDKKFRDREKLFLAEGIKLAREALEYSETEAVLVSESRLMKDSAVLTAAEEAASRNISVTVFSDSAFEKISTEKAPQGVIAVVKYLPHHVTSDFEAWQNGKKLVMLSGVRDTGNLGTILRSAEALGIDGAVIHDSADIYSPKTVRATMGTLFRLPLFFTDDGAGTVKKMKSLGRRVLASSLGEHTLVLGEYKTDKTDCVIIGNEGHGISEEIISESSASLMIPMAGNAESLNASAAAACILWEYFRDK